MNALVKELSCIDQEMIEDHFLALASADRRLRFGGGLNDDAVRSYVANIDFDCDAVFGVLDDELQLIAAARPRACPQLGRRQTVHALPDGKQFDDASGQKERYGHHGRQW